jgi:AmpD protein
MTNFFIDDAGWLQYAGWLQSVEVIKSPNFDSRPENVGIKLVVVHGISLPPGEYGGGHIQNFFCNQLDANAHEYFESICSMTISAHCLIERDGNIVQFVSFQDRAWHAGESQWRGETDCNNYSVGIELEGCDDQAYTDVQYHSLVGLITALRANYPDIDANSITGHSEIAPGRKTDPGPAFDWDKLKQLV